MSAFYTTVAKYYDAETGDKTDDLILYSQLAEQHGAPILDVGCGTGRVVLHLAQEGYAVTGIDNDRAMLNRLDTKLQYMPHLRNKLTIIEGDVLMATYDTPFKLILLTYNALMHFHEQATQIQLLKQLHSTLDDNSLLIIDLPNAGDVFGSQDTDNIVFERTFLEPENGHLIMLQSISQLNRTTQLLHVQWIYDEIDEDGVVHRLIAPHILRYYFYAEMQLLLSLCGFTITAVYGDTDQSPFEDGSERMIIYAKAK